MNAEIMPLRGKYYGTIVEICDETELKIWTRGDGEPSDRQIGEWGLSRTQWDSGRLGKYSRGDFICDDHYETAHTLAICEVIVRALRDAPELHAEVE